LVLAKGRTSQRGQGRLGNCSGTGSSPLAEPGPTHWFEIGGSPKACRNWLWGLIDAEPENGSLHRKLAINLKYQNRIYEAIESFCTALNLNAADAESLMGLGLGLLNLGQADESLVLFLKALALDPDNGDALACTGLALRNLGDRVQACK